MECNVGKTEKVVRLLLGLLFIWLGYAGSPWWYLVAVILIITASIGFCPLTKVLGINTCKLKEKKNKEPSVPEEAESQEEQQTKPEQETKENK